MADGLGHYGMLLLEQFEPGPDGKIATTAYRCPGGRYTLGLGATEWPPVPPAIEGRPIRKGEFCTEEQAVALTNWSVQKFAACVDRVIKRPMTTNQRDAFLLLAYNIGEHAFEHNCTASRLFNEGAPDVDVAAAFAMWCKATSSGPEKSDLGNPYYTPIIGDDEDGDKVWIDADGKPTRYQRAFPGMSRRHLSEGCLFLSLDWRQACRKDTVSITSNRVWDERDNRWEDLVRKKTELADILPLAKQYPLPAVPSNATTTIITDTPAAPPQATAKAGQPEPATQPAPAAPAQNPAASTSGPLKDAAGPAVQAAPAPPVSVPKAAPPVVVAGQDGAKPKSPNTLPPADVPYRIDPNAGLKPIDETDRGKGYVIQQVGIGVIRLGSLGMFGTTIQGGAQVVQGDPVLSNILLMGFVCVGIMVVGYVTRVYGDWKRKRGEANASQGMY